MFENEGTYDTVAYRSTAIPECDPLRMATIAHLHGLEAPSPLDCDVLDIGCGDGTNLLSLAVAHPGLRGVGIDPAAEAIARGEALRTAAGIHTVQLRTEAAEGELDASADYVVAHGVLSWVDPGPRAEVIELAARAVRPGGLVTMSFNAFPASRARLAARDLALTAIRRALAEAEADGRELPVPELTAIGIARVRLAAEFAGTRSLHGQIMVREADRMAALEPWALFHDDLSDPMQPFRVTEVAELLAPHGLRYVGELVPQDLWSCRLPAPRVEQIRELAGPGALERQQLVDDFLDAWFHASLFVRADEAPSADLAPRDHTLHVRGFAHGTPDGDRQADAVSAPVSATIREHRPRVLTVPEICAEIALDEEATAAAALKMDAASVAQVSTYPPPPPSSAGRRPRTSPLVAAQAARGDAVVTTRLHRPFVLAAPVDRVLLGLLDGTRDLADVRRDLPDAATEAGLSAAAAGVLADLEERLALAAEVGLLMPADDEG